MSASCEKVKDVMFLAKVPITENFLKRLKCIPICDIQKRIATARATIEEHCEIIETPPEPEPEPEPEVLCCPIMVTTPEVVQSMYLINVEDLDQEVQDLMTLLEAEACDTLEKLVELEELLEGENCWEV